MSSISREKTHTLGAIQGDYYLISAETVDISRPAPPIKTVTIETDTGMLTADLNKSAIIIIDMQNDFCEKGGWLHSAGADMQVMQQPVEPINSVNDALRAQGVPVIWLNWGNRPDLFNVPAIVQFPFHQLGQGVGLSDPQPANSIASQAEGSRVLEKDSWGAQVIDSLVQKPSDIHIDKYRISGFRDSQLDSILRKLGIQTILFAGVNADQCVLATLMDATFLGYDALLLNDCVATSSPGFCLEATLYNVRSVFGFVTDGVRLVHALGQR